MTSTTQTLRQLRLDEIQADPNNARKTFDSAGLQELADSISEQGLIQPVTVRITDSGTVQLIAGERRFRACQILEMETIPTIVMEMDDKAATLAGLIENLQRTDLDPFEEGDGYRTAMEAHGWDITTLATKLGKSRPVVSKALARTRVDAGVRKQMLEKGWAAGSVDEVVKLGKDRQVELIEAFGDKAPTRADLRKTLVACEEGGVRRRTGSAVGAKIGRDLPLVEGVELLAELQGGIALLEQRAALCGTPETLEAFGQVVDGRGQQSQLPFLAGGDEVGVHVGDGPDVGTGRVVLACLELTDLLHGRRLCAEGLDQLDLAVLAELHDFIDGPCLPVRLEQLLTHPRVHAGA